MNKTYIKIQFIGDKFSPKDFKSKTNLPIEVLVEYGENAKMGRFKGNLSPYGIGLLTLNAKDNKLTNYYLDILLSFKNYLTENVDEIIFDILTSPNNTSYSIPSDISKKIASLNARIELNFIEEKKAKIIPNLKLSEFFSFVNTHYVPESKRISAVLIEIEKNTRKLPNVKKFNSKEPVLKD